MELTIDLVLLVIAAVFFALAGLNVDNGSRGRFNSIGLGLFFLTLSFIL